MAKPFRGKSQPQMTHLRPDIVLIEHSDPGAEDARALPVSSGKVKVGTLVTAATDG